MSKVGAPERVTQNRVAKLFQDELGYGYLGFWQDREGNSNIEEAELRKYLDGAGYSEQQIAKAIHALQVEATNHQRSLYNNNKAVYSLLRYGVNVKVAAGENADTVHLINWGDPTANRFAIAEEVTLKDGNHERRPDIVLYINGIAIGVIELKNSRVSIGDGIRQNLSNQQPEFNEWFFTTVQILFAGNDSEGLKYGTIGTPEKYYLEWKEDLHEDVRFKLDKYLLKMCAKERLLELLHDFVLFDAGVKKLPRVHQYFGIKAAQEHVNDGRGGIIWHTQGSGKSIVMVLLAKWILENKPNARVAIITDREDLDSQIEGVFAGIGEPIDRASSRRDLLTKLGTPNKRLICSLVHKFGRDEAAGLSKPEFERYIEKLQSEPSPAVGDLFMLVDECHRTQNGRLNRIMKAILPGAVFIGFSGTPLLRKDRKTTKEVFGSWIHKYKFPEAVEDNVVLDLLYEARDIEQRLGSQTKIDQWFSAKTRGLNDWQKAQLREQWGTMQKVLSSRSRMSRVVADIVLDFGTKDRLSSQRGTAMLVARDIYEACRYFELFQQDNTGLRDKCAVITSYNPRARDVSLEETGANTDTEKEFIFNLYTKLLENVVADAGLTKTETYEHSAKEKFKKEPANMKLLIVVDKLLTGFDAPSCSYLYIDKSMQDHGLFQAICRTNRLDGEDKHFGFIVDYKNLLKKVEKAIAVYSSELDDDDDDPQILLRDRLEAGRERLESAREKIRLLCEPVAPPRGELEHIHFFCGNTELPDDLAAHERERVQLYKCTVSLIRAYASIADELEGAGYSSREADEIKQQVDEYVKLREVIRRASGEVIDLKAYEADMRHLVDTYIEADEARVISMFEGVPLLELIVKSGIAEAVASLPAGLRNNKDAVAETIANNVRSTIIKEHLNDPAYYDEMSVLLAEIVADLRAKRIEYEAYLKRVADLATKVHTGTNGSSPASLDTPGRRALFNNLGKNEDLALKVDYAVRAASPDGWRGTQARERIVKGAIWSVVEDDDEVERLFKIIEKHSEY